MKNFTRIAVSLLGLLFALSTTTQAQTMYKSDPGFFTPVLESFDLRGGSFISTQKIGPALGYRFNENFDFSIHSEFLFSETDFENRDNEAISLLNLGITGGHTADVSNRFMIRSEISLYQLFVFSKQGLDGFKPSLTSGLASSALYWELPISGTTSLLPNFGGFMGYGSYSNQVSTSLTQGFDGFVAGPQFGLDLLFRFSDSFYLALQPRYRTYFYTTYDNDSDGQFSLNFQFNF